MDITTTEIREIMEKAKMAVELSSISDASLFREIGVDSLDLANIFLEIEEKYEVKIPDEDVETLDCINSIVNYLASK